ncbi:hypothetical protein GE09DRAFT_1181872 [Coniochaeta sp. 2T2.1]|nr:hypothetical protein GE09DRAFT_1181872 [Coniochaeta sp. 2T2.1]
MANSSNIVAELGPLLSPESSIVSASDAKFASLTSRWREHLAPVPSVVVQAASEADVQHIVRYAAKHDIPFVARAGGHGATAALGTVQNAIQIDIRPLDHVKVSEDGNSAKIGGGADIKGVVTALEKLGKRAVTGVCENVGFSAPLLGGGHGYLQGQYGLMADQVISARLVLPDGELVVVSETENQDLFWAIRGAGHNFGIVTEWEYRVYEAKKKGYAYETLIFSGDKAEAVFEAANSLLDDQPAERTQWAYIVNIPPVDPDHPVIWFAYIYDGPLEPLHTYAKPLHDLGPLSVQSAEDCTFHDIAVMSFQDANGLGCAYGFTSIRSPIRLNTYNVSAIRKVYDEIDEMTHRHPEFAGSIFLLEGYANQGVKTADPDSTAYPYRNERLLLTCYVNYKPDQVLDDVAQEFAQTLRQHLLEGSDDPARLKAYVNYANGDEPLEAVYGWEEWRLERLRRLKKKWDPDNRMRYYVPIE